MSAEATSQLGLIAIVSGEYHEALEYHTKHLSICEQLGDVGAMAKAYDNMRFALESLGEEKEAAFCRSRASALLSQRDSLAAPPLVMASLSDSGLPPCRVCTVRRASVQNN